MFKFSIFQVSLFAQIEALVSILLSGEGGGGGGSV